MGELAQHWLAGRLAVVTGASRGIGAATAVAMAAAGAHVMLAARDRQALDGVAGRIKDAGGQATPVPTDVSNEAAVERLFAEVAAAGRLSALVCAAGVLTPAPFAGTTSATVARDARGQPDGYLPVLSRGVHRHDSLW